jgi:hypothetical protein
MQRLELLDCLCKVGLVLRHPGVPHLQAAPSGCDVHQVSYPVVWDTNGLQLLVASTYRHQMDEQRWPCSQLLHYQLASSELECMGMQQEEEQHPVFLPTLVNFIVSSSYTMLTSLQQREDKSRGVLQGRSQYPCQSFLQHLAED